ncbi:uncharacterized protein [Dermacentor albipictus]
MERKTSAPSSAGTPTARPSERKHQGVRQPQGEDQGEASIIGTQLHPDPKDIAEPQPGGSAGKETRTAISPRRLKPIVAYVRDLPEKRLCEVKGEVVAAVPSPFSSRPAAAVPRGRGKSSKAWRARKLSSSEFDFPPELPLPKLPSGRDGRDSQSGARNSGDEGTNRGATLAAQGSASPHQQAPSVIDGKLREHGRHSIGAEGVTCKDPGQQFQDNAALCTVLDVATSATSSVPTVLQLSADIPGTGQVVELEESRKCNSKDPQFSPTDLENNDVEPPSVHSSPSVLSPAREPRDSQLPDMGPDTRARTSRPRYPVAFPSYSSESLRKLAGSRERRGALTPTRDQLQNLYNTLVMSEHPPRRERLSREAFRKKFFLPKGAKVAFPSPGFSGHPASSSTSMARMKDKSPMSHESYLDDVVSSRMKRAAVTSCVVLAVAVTLLALFHAFRSTSPSQRARGLLCITDDCRLHALYLDYNLNYAFSPCKDFDGHVCSSWTPSQTYAELGATVLGELAVKWVGNLPLLLRGAVDVDKVAERPLLMYEACVKERDNATALDATLFLAFLKELNLGWPETSPSQVSALGVLVDLAFRWQMTFWLSFQLRKDASRGARLYIETGDGDVLSQFAMNHRYVMQRDSYVEYWMSHYTALYGDTASVPPSSQVQASAAEQTYIIKVLTDVRTKNAQFATVLPIGRVGNQKGRITSSEWLRHLKKYLSGEAFQSYSDQVLSDSSLLDAISLLFNTYDDQQLIHHFSWQFVQMYFLVLDRTPLQIVHWGKTYSAAYVPVYCAMYVEEVYRPLLASIHIELAISPSDISRLNFALASLMEKVVSALNASQLEPGAKRSALARYQSMQVRVWPPGRYYSEDEVENAYRCCPRSSDSFVRLWTECQRCLRRAPDTPFHRESSGMHRLLSSSPVTYDPVANELAVAVSALAHPLYYPHGTPAMFYGGLGFLFVAETLKALGRAPIAALAKASATLDAPEAVGNRSERRCFAVQRNDTRATYFAALNVAYSAFAEDAASEVQERRRPISRRHSEESVFFLTACRMMCRAPGSNPLGAIDCNALFRHSPQFANAFACARESTMNPGQRCVYFGDSHGYTI